VVGLRAASERKKRKQCCGNPPHPTFVPAMARTICFWKTM
jgi:hypothetical protein